MSSASKSLLVALVAVLFLCCVIETSSFLMGKINGNMHKTSLESSTSAAGNAVVSLIKKAKLKVVNKLLREVEEAGDSHPINQFLKEGVTPVGLIGKPVDFHYNLKENVGGVGCIGILPEYNMKAKTGFIAGMPPAMIMGGMLRDAGAKGIVVSMDERSGGTSVEEFTRFAVEQTRALLFLPPPMPVIWNDQVMHTIQIAQAASCGASAIVLNPEVTTEIDAFTKYAFELHMEPVVLVKSLQDADLAIASGARSLCLHSMGDEALIELKNDIFLKHESAADDLVMIAKIRPEEDFPIYHEIDLCWILRDNGFAAVWPSPESVFGTGFPDIYPNVMAMRAKASRVFLSPRQFLMDRKKEGATEYLGDILY